MSVDVGEGSRRFGMDASGRHAQAQLGTLFAMTMSWRRAGHEMDFLERSTPVGPENSVAAVTREFPPTMDPTTVRPRHGPV